MSLLALMMASDLGEARSLTPGANTVVPTAAAQQAAIAAAQQAAGAAAQAQASLARAAAALAAARKLQQDAAAAARGLPSSVPDGLTTGGLMPAGGTASDPLAGIKADPSKWRGADLPKQTTSGTQVNVDINQIQQKGIFYWDTFNVGANTTVNFNQSASDWIALNRVIDPSAAPSRILGQINALGSVYLINRNGIIFGAGSQVNVHTLIASSLDIGLLGTSLGDRDDYFLKSGVDNLNSFSVYDPVGGAQTTLVPGDIGVQRGASITANIATDRKGELNSRGTVYLFGANVANSGSITAPTGEVGMVAARTIDLVPNGYSALPPSVLGTDSQGKLLQFRGTEFRISQFASSYGTSGYSNGSSYLPRTGAVTHDGLIEASRGIVIMNGDRVSIDNPRAANSGALRDAAGNLVQGVISADTSIDRNSMVLLRAATSVTTNGVISSLPLDDGAVPLPSGTSSGSTVQSFTPAYIEMSAQSTVTVGSTGLVSAPSAQVALRAINLGRSASGVYQTGLPGLFNQGANPNGGNQDFTSNTHNSPQTVLLAPGATIDVAGLQNVELPASYNFIPFKPAGEFADMPLQRPPHVSVAADGSGVVYNQTLWIDMRASGTRSDGTTWVGTPLADASGVVGAVGRSIYQLMTVGGGVSLQTDLGINNGGGGVQTAGSVINVAGGSVKFLPGMVNTTRLLGADGRIYSMANADPNMTYLGIAGQFTVKHSRWGVTETWSTGTQVYSPGYTDGHDAGSVSVTTVTPLLTGTMYFGSVAGERQIGSGSLPLQGSLALTTPSSVQIGSAPSADYTTQSAYTTTLSANTLSGYGLSALNVTANDLVVSSGSALNLAPGGSLSVLTGGAIDIAGTVSAAGGAINLVTDRAKITGNQSPFGSAASALFKAPTDQSGNVIAANIFVEGILDVSGRFVNDSGRTASDVSGPAFINGGAISITTNKGSDNGRDLTGSILLTIGSLLDVSSGGYISPQGRPKTVATGLMAGKAGAISLSLYEGYKWGDPPQGTGPFRPASGPAAVLELDGRLRGYGFESNGGLRLAGADTIRIDGTLQSGETSLIQIGGRPSVLPVALLIGGGFGAYTIESVADGWSPGYVTTANIVVSAGVNLTLQQQNLSSTIDYTTTATGSKLGQQANPALALLPDDQRKPVNLTLKADNILLDTGTTLVTDPNASVIFGNTDRALALTDPTRNVPANSVELRGNIVDHGGSVFINALKTHLGSQALVDLSGTFVANSRFGATNGPATNGTYLAGGTFSVEAGAITQISDGANAYYGYGAPSNGSYLVADAGAQLDVSGSAGAIQVAGARGATSSVWSWSDAGTVNADVSGFAWGGSFAAMGGRHIGSDGSAQADARANNGTIILGGNSIFLRQDTTDINTALLNFKAGSAPQSLFVAADQLAPFDNVYLYAASATGGAARIFTDLPGNIYGYKPAAFGSLIITGALDWSVANRLHIAAGGIGASTPVNAQLSAPYVLLTGGVPLRDGGFSPADSSRTLTVNGQTIDVEGAAFSGFGQVNLISSGDLRLSTPKVTNGVIALGDTVPTESSSFAASKDSAGTNMRSDGDLLLSAKRLYPVTAVNFIIQTPGNVTFEAPAASKTNIPLSAGGGITVIAKNIDQGGNLFAPLGTIVLGSASTQSVTLEPGSLTSVTLADTIVPYGATADGTDWYYNANLNPLSQPPSKGLVLAGATVTRAYGSTIDLRGGGDLQAMQWIKGNGGSRDTLTTTPSGQTVYALLPSQSDPVSAFDIHLTTARSLDGGKNVIAGDAYPLAGTQITIDGSGIPAGTYTLYPAHYATLPGAMRAVYYGDNTGRNRTGSLPDGTVVVAGHYTQSTSPAKQSSGQSLFAVQTNAVWRQYGDYSFNGANSYFSQQAAKQGVPVPRLPMDAGRLGVIAQKSIVLDGIALAQPGQDSSGNAGRGGELDISAPKLAVVGHAQYVNNDIPDGYVGLDVAQLTGFESVLIGGQRTDFAAGTLITPTATNVVVDTRGNKFTAPEILLVARQVGQFQEVKQWLNVGSGANNSVLVDFPVYQPVAGTGSVTIKAGSIIETTGTIHAGFGRNYIVVSDGQAPVTAASLAAALGGTLSGTEIDNADLVNLPASWYGNGFQSAPYIVSNSASQASLTYFANGGAQQPGRGALFVASNDPTLVLTGPTATGVSAPTLTIKFADVTSADASNVSSVPGAPSGPVPIGQVIGSLTLPGGDTSNSGQVSIADGVRISTNTLTLQATAMTNAIAIKTADLHAKQVNLTAPTIGIGASTPVADKSLVLASNSAQFADVQGLALKALSGPITVYGDFNPGPRGLTLDTSGIALGTEVLNPGTSLNLRGDSLVVFPQAATVQFSVGVTVTSAAGVVTTYAANTPIALGADSKVSLADAGTLTVSGPDAVTLSHDSMVTASGSITLKNTAAPPFSGGTAANGNTFALVAKEIDLGGGYQTIAGFSQVNWTASDRVLIAGPGAMTLGVNLTDKVDLTVTTPSILVAGATAANSRGFVLTSFAGNVSVEDSVAGNGIAARPADSTEIGGSLEITASNIAIASTIQAQAGTITLNAIAGNVTLNAGAYLAAGGYKKTLVDVDIYGAGGKVVLYADIGAPFLPTGSGQVIADPGSIIDVAQVVDPAHAAVGLQGYGGEINVTAPRGGATLAGTLRGDGGPGLGGRFKLDTKGSADLTALADNLRIGGITGAIAIHTRTGNLELSQGHTLKANTVTLTADDSSWDNTDTTRQFGQVVIGGTVNADGYAGNTADGSGQAGGQVGLFGHNAVVLTGTGQILARSTHADERGGDVKIGTAWSALGYIDLQSGSKIDVSGGSKGGLSGGTVTLRAPRDGNDDVMIAGLDATITGARAVNIQGFLTINTKASPNDVNGLDGSNLGPNNGTWGGTIDPAGWYKPDGSIATDGSWTNIGGWQISASKSAVFIGFRGVPSGEIPITTQDGSGSGATLRNFVMGVFTFQAQNPGFAANQNNIPVTFPTPPGGVAAQGIASTNANGDLVISITNPGRGYTSPPATAIVGGITVNASMLFGNIRSTLQIVSAEINLPAGGGGYDSAIAPTARVAGASGIEIISFTNVSGLSGKTHGTTFAPDTLDYIPFKSSGVYSAFDPAKQGTPGVADFTGGDSSNGPFFATTLKQITQGTWTYNNKSYGFTKLFNRLQPLVDQLGAGVVHVQPGVELVNSGGDITVATNWNLGAGTAFDLQPGTNPLNNQSFQYFDPAKSYVNFIYRLGTPAPWGGLEAGALTLRASGNINIKASISDGFLQTGNYLDPNYLAWVADYVTPVNVGNSGRVIDPGTLGLYTYYLNNYSSSSVPIAPYRAVGNAISPTAQDLVSADLFPHTLRVCTVDCSAANIKTVTAPSSWSYAFTAGADVSSANPMARKPLATAQTANNGDVTIDNHSTYTQSLIKDTAGTTSVINVNLPTMVRTGTGNIAIAAARDVILKDIDAPGVIYAAGVNTAKLADPNYSGVSNVVAGNPDGFFEPRVLAYGNNATNIANGAGLYYGPPTAAAFPQQGGDVEINAQRDVRGHADSGNKAPQYYQPWLLADTGLTPTTANAASSVKLFGAGVFAPSGTQIASQTAWWIQYGSFQQGILSASGNVSVIAGRDMVDVSVSLPTTGRVSGGLSPTSVPVTHIYDSGNMVVRAGRDILGGSFYEGSGHASVVAGGAVGHNGTVSRYGSSKLLLPDYPLLAVDTGKIEILAAGPIAVAGVINPAELHAQQPSFANPLDPGGNSAKNPLYVDTYGPDSKVRLVAQTGDVTIAISPTAITDQSGGGSQPVYAAAAIYPASFEALALNGSLITKGLSTTDATGKVIALPGASIPMPGIVLSPSEHGTFELLAQRSVDLTFGYPPKTSSSTGIIRPFISAGPALIDTAFDPFQPNNGFGDTSSGAVLAHKDDAAAGLDTLARIYAATGDVTATGSYGQAAVNGSNAGYQRVEINRPTKVYAGRDIVDLNIILQNIHTSDVSTIQAGRNIYYTGYNNAGGLQVAGPGFFVVQAGGDIGPFLPAAHDNAGEAAVQEGIASVGNASTTPVGNFNVSGAGGSVGIYDTALLGPSANPRRNVLLTEAAGTRQGADIVTLFGTKFGIDYQAVINAYIDPANAANVDHNYVAELQAFLTRVGKPASANDAASVFGAFRALSADLQHVFVDQVFFAELRAVGISQTTGAAQFQRGYKVINAMFPSSLGYTANALGGGTNGANQLVKTGDLNLLHATVQTRLGGEISIFGPAGNIIVGSLAVEPNPSLKLRDLGILTLGGGAINTFTDESVRVNSSRVLTTQGGDVLMWSSNGDLDAGRGSKTTLSAPALQVQFDQNDYQSIDLGGFVTGSGIGTLQASNVAEASNLYLLAPRGTIDAGTAGIRVSGNAVFVAPVISNSSSIQVQGTSSGIPVVSVPNIGALTSGSNSAGAAAKSADTPTAAGANGDRASIFMVEVIGYGGGDGQGQPSTDGEQPSDAQSSDKRRR